MFDRWIHTACFSCSPPDLNFLDPYFIFLYMHYNHCHWATAHLQLNIIVIIIISSSSGSSNSLLALYCIFFCWQVYDGNNTNSTQLFFDCSSNLPDLNNFTSTGNQLLIHMRTGSILTAKGFRANYKLVSWSCSRWSSNLTILGLKGILFPAVSI